MTDQNNDVKQKVQDLALKFQAEVKKAAQIGVKMISASKTNSALNDLYQDVGRLVYEGKERNSEEVQKIFAQIKEKIDELSAIDSEVEEIKKSN